MLKKAAGVTMLELMLVILIGAAIVIFGLQQYQQYQKNQYAIQLRSTVDSLLEALGSYYQANCETGTLSPTSMTFPPSPIAFDDGGRLLNDLQNGYLPANVLFFNPIVDNTATNQGYAVQLNFFQSTNPAQPGRRTQVCYSFWGTSTGAGCSDTPLPTPNTMIIGWQIQVAVKIKDPATILNYVGLTGADCAVESLTPGVPADCGSSTGSTNPLRYLIWQRLPAFASSAINSSLWLSNPLVKQFKAQYTHDEMYELYMNNTATSPYYYLCGS